MKKILFLILICVAAELALPDVEAIEGKASFAATAREGKASFAATARDGKASFVATAREGKASFVATAKIQIMTKDADLGEVEKNKIFDFEIEVKNVGKEELVITNISSSCGCLEVVAAELALPQGDDGKASFAATAREGKASFAATIKPNHSIYITAKVDTNKVGGEFEKMIHIFSNDPENKDVVWKVRGRVIAVAAELALPQGDDGKASFAATARDGKASFAATARDGKASFAATARDGKVNFAATDRDAQVIMVFYSPGCKECREIMEKFLPEIKQKYNDKILIVDYNIDNMESYEFFLELQNKHDERAKKGFFNPKPPAIFVNETLLYGEKEIKENLAKMLK